MQIGLIFDTKEQLDYHVNFLAESLAKLMIKHKDDIIVLWDKTEFHFITIDELSKRYKWLGRKFDKVYEFALPENLDKVRKELYFCTREKRIRDTKEALKQ